MGGNGIFSVEHRWARHYFHLFSAAGVSKLYSDVYIMYMWLFNTSVPFMYDDGVFCHRKKCRVKVHTWMKFSITPSRTLILYVNLEGIIEATHFYQWYCRDDHHSEIYRYSLLELTPLKWLYCVRPAEQYCITQECDSSLITASYIHWLAS